MIREKSLSSGGSILFFITVFVRMLSLPAPAVAGWETVKEFYGTITITQTLDHETDLDGQKQILKKNVSATVSVTGHTFDGAYSWPIGTITGTMSTESKMISSDGATVHGTFSGKINKRFDGEHHGGPGLRVNRKEGLYRISLPHLYAKGTATLSVPHLGTRTDPDSEDDAKPFMPERYKKPVPYDPEAGSITGGFTHPEKIPTFPKPMVVTTTANWNLTFDIPPLKAVAGAAQTVERGEKVTLDGSGSTGRIEDYTWAFEKGEGCPSELSDRLREMKGPVVEVTALCSLSARLTVSDGSDEEKDSTTVTVKPRDWETSFQHVPDEDVLDPSVTPVYGSYVNAFNGGANSCAEDGQATSDSHIFHPAASDGTWEGNGYSLVMIDDQGGPFDGFWYPNEYDLQVIRITLLNKYTIPGGPITLAGLGVNFYDKNKAEGTDVDLYLEKVRDHEYDHSLRFQEWLRSGDPAEGIEKAAGRDRDALKEEIDGKLMKAESDICHAGKDPLPLIWTGTLWFGNANGVGWTLGEVDVGGPYQKQIECP